LTGFLALTGPVRSSTSVDLNVRLPRFHDRHPVRV
jgi:hypothetical protein